MPETTPQFIDKMIRYFEQLPSEYPDRELALAVAKRWREFVDGGPEGRSEIRGLYEDFRPLAKQNGSPAVEELTWRMKQWLEEVG
jgi:hypothetical protein